MQPCATLFVSIKRKIIMFIFILATLFLILGYCIYGLIIEKLLGINSRLLTPAVRLKDDIDFVPMHPTKIFLIQFLNIAGLGPVFGSILGALYGPVVLLWIVFGSIFAGAVHDMLAGFISIRNNGGTMIVLVQKYFGKKFYIFFMFLLTTMLLLVGSIFAQQPAKLLTNMTNLSFIFWIIIIFGYYFLATLLPINKIIGYLYPVFGCCLIITTVALICVLFMQGNTFYPNLERFNQHPDGNPIFPIMFITTACGALSGFHATQSPVMARCLPNEKYTRPCFYGAMILEGFIALVWATVGICFYQGSQGLSQALGSAGDAGRIVQEISKGLLGNFGGFLAVLSIIFLTITSGDTTLRSARLSISEILKFDQKRIWKRLLLSTLILSGAIGLTFCDLKYVWQYFGWSNQFLATIMLWTGAIYLRKTGRNYWIALVPATFISTVTMTCLAYAKYTFNLNLEVSRWIGCVVTLTFMCLFFYKIKGRHKEGLHLRKVLHFPSFTSGK